MVSRNQPIDLLLHSGDALQLDRQLAIHVIEVCHDPIQYFIVMKRTPKAPQTPYAYGARPSQDRRRSAR